MVLMLKRKKMSNNNSVFSVTSVVKQPHVKHMN